MPAKDLYEKTCYESNLQIPLSSLDSIKGL